MNITSSPSQHRSAAPNISSTYSSTSFLRPSDYSDCATMVAPTVNYPTVVPALNQIVDVIAKRVVGPSDKGGTLIHFVSSYQIYFSCNNSTKSDNEARNSARERLRPFQGSSRPSRLISSLARTGSTLTLTASTAGSMSRLSLSM